MTPLNYTDKAVEALSAATPVLSNDPLMPGVLTYLLRKLASAQRFLAPDNGFVFGESVQIDLRKMLRKGSRLPFPVMTVEYRHQQGVFPLYEGAPYLSLRRLALAIDLTVETERAEAAAAFVGLRKFLDARLDGDGMLILPIDSLEDPALVAGGFWSNGMGRLDQYWLPPWLGFIAPYDQARDDPDRGVHNASLPEKLADGTADYPIVGEWYPFPIGQTGYQRADEVIQSGRNLVDASHEYVSEVVTTLAMTAALSCRNVRTRLIQPDSKLQKARARKGRPPLATYHEVVLEAGGERERVIGGPAGDGRLRASPTEHLRRGHIRLLPSGPVWVNFAIVNPGKKSAPTKAYRVVPPRA